MKIILVFLMLLIFTTSIYAYDLNGCKDGNSLADIGECVQIGVFGDSFFFALIMILMFMIFMWQSRIPAGASIGLGLIMLFGLSPWLLGAYATLLNLTILAIGVTMGIAMLHFLRR